MQKFIYLLCSENTAILNAIGKFISISVMKNKKFEYIYCVVARFHFWLDELKDSGQRETTLVPIFWNRLFIVSTPKQGGNNGFMEKVMRTFCGIQETNISFTFSGTVLTSKRFLLESLGK